MILEQAVLQIKPDQAEEFEAAFQQAAGIIATMPGYIDHKLHRCLSVENQYLLLVRWQTIDAHRLGFRRSPEYQTWKKLLHHFYDPFPVVEYYEVTDT